MRGRLRLYGGGGLHGVSGDLEEPEGGDGTDKLDRLLEEGVGLGPPL